MAGLWHHVHEYISHQVRNKGLRPVLLGFVVTIHEVVCKRKSNPEAIGLGDVTHCSHKPECIVTTNPSRTGLNHDYNMTFSIPPCQYSPLKIQIWCLKWEPFHMLLQLLCHVVPLNSGNCHLTIPVIKGHYACDVVPHTFNISVLISVEKNSATIKHIHNVSANIIESCNVAFDTND